MYREYMKIQIKAPIKKGYWKTYTDIDKTMFIEWIPAKQFERGIFCRPPNKKEIIEHKIVKK
jgi:hypothetical protein